MTSTSRSGLYGVVSALLVSGALVFPPAAYGQAERPGEGTTVESARPTWDTGWFTTEIYNRMLEELGYDVRPPRTLDNPIFYQAVSQGDVDFWVEGWFPLHNTYTDAPGFEDAATIVGYVARGGALQGYLIDKRTAEEHGITNLEDFKNPEIAALFDTTGDGRAELVACPPGWGCELVIEHHMDAYDLRDHVNTIQAAYAASMADALARYQQGEPIFFYTWTPNWTVGLLEPGEDVVWLEVPFASLPEDQAEFEDETVVEGVEGCVADPCDMGWPANDIRTVANNDFLEANPAAKRLFEVAEIPLADIFEQNARMFEGEDSEDDLRRHAEEWIEANRDLVDGWLEEARNAAM
jgi:glycine betaine/proline transport system substrate-binding protein